jgi:hypothetical protein
VSIFQLDFGAVPTVWYFGTVPTVWYFGTVSTVWYFVRNAITYLQSICFCIGETDETLN